MRKRNPPRGSLTIDALKQTLCEILYMPGRERRKRVLFQEVKDAHAVQLRDETRVIAMIKLLFEVDTFAAGQPCPALDQPSAYFRFDGSCFLRVSSTRISILLASRYFCTARMILIATFRLVEISRASTTLPNVPWPSRRMILSARQHPSARGTPSTYTCLQRHRRA